MPNDDSAFIPAPLGTLANPYPCGPLGSYSNNFRYCVENAADILAFIEAIRAGVASQDRHLDSSFRSIEPGVRPRWYYDSLRRSVFVNSGGCWNELCYLNSDGTFYKVAGQWTSLERHLDSAATATGAPATDISLFCSAVPASVSAVLVWIRDGVLYTTSTSFARWYRADLHKNIEVGLPSDIVAHGDNYLYVTPTSIALRGPGGTSVIIYQRPRRVPNAGVPVVWADYRNPAGITPKVSADKSRIVGVEIEVNGVSDFRRVRNVVHYSGCSVKRDTSCGWELVTPPTRAADIADVVIPVTAALRAAGETADERCGLHVHVDARDLEPADVGKLLALWSRIQPIMYAFAGQERYQGRYASAWDLSDTEKFLTRGASAITYLTDRYHDINVTNYVSGLSGKRTIEFRLHRGTLDGERIVSWARLLAALTSKARRSSADNIRELIKLSPLRCLLTAAPKHKAFVYSALKQYRDDTRADAQVSRNIVFTPKTVEFVQRSPGRRGHRGVGKLPEFLATAHAVVGDLASGAIGEGCLCQHCLLRYTIDRVASRGLPVPDIGPESPIMSLVSEMGAAGLENLTRAYFSGINRGSIDPIESFYAETRNNATNAA